MLDGTPTALCLENGLWSHPAPICAGESDVRAFSRPALCPYGTLGNGTIAAPRSVTVGAIATFGCNVGYSMSGAFCQCVFLMRIFHLWLCL